MMINNILKKFDVKYNCSKLKPLPNSVIFASLVVSMSAISQFLADVIIELMSLARIIPVLPFRVDFLSLTALSALLAYQTLLALRRGDMEPTQDVVSVSFLVEIALIIGDLFYMYNNGGFGTYFSFVRLPFLILTLVNALLVGFIVMRMDLFSFFRSSFKLD